MTETNPDQVPPNRASAEEAPPLFAESRKLDWRAPLRWVRLGWRDIRRAPGPSLSYGAVLVAFSYVITYLLYSAEHYVLLFSLLTGFVLLGPALAFGMYDVSCQLEKDRRPTLGHCLLESKRHLGNELVFAVVLLIILLVWARAASMIHIFFPAADKPSLADLATFLAVGSTVGAFFAALVFAVSAFSLPMIMDRDVDVITAALTSINAVLNNKGVMVLWAAMIVASVIIGFATAFLGLAVLLPLIGHATWHAYRETIEQLPGRGENGGRPSAGT
jgi:uncharacterized membrane protein